MDKIEKLLSLKAREGQSSIQHNLNKMTALERIEMLLDTGSFIEIGSMIGKNGAGVVTGYGTIERRLVYIYSHDYEVNGGTIDSINSKKICNIMDMAVKMGAPLIQIYDSVGGKILDGLETLSAYGKILSKNAQLSGVIPQIAVIAGPCTGAAAISAATCDFTIMVRKSGEFYINTPENLMETEKVYINTNNYADALTCEKNGSVQITVEDEKEAIYAVKKLFDFIPSNNVEGIPLNEEEELTFVNEQLNDMVRNEDYDMKKVIKEVCDNDSLIEINNGFEEETITTLGKVNGRVVGIIGNSGNINNDKLNKMTRMVKICNSFNIPLLSIVNSDGFKVDMKEEKQGLALSSSKFFSALVQADIPKVSLIIGKAYGSIFTMLCGKEGAFDIVYAWPSAKVAVTNPEKIIMSKYRDEVLSSENPKNKENEVIKFHLDEVTSPYSAAEKGFVDDIILPSETRIRIFAALDMLATKKVLAYSKKHGTTLV